MQHQVLARISEAQLFLVAVKGIGQHVRLLPGLLNLSWKHVKVGRNLLPQVRELLFLRYEDLALELQEVLD